ncbi:MAG: ribose-5-phosphate isomerase RpiA [Thermoplasmata archaeon]
MPEDLGRAKAAAARYAVERYIRPDRSIALGTGSTAAEAVRALARQFPQASLDCVASSRATEDLARSLGVPVRPLRSGDRFHVMLDGADEVSPDLDLTKGGGGALFREKLLARLSDDLVILVDPTKLVRALGERHPIPIEVVPYARPVVEHAVAGRGYRSHLRTAPGGEPFRTDNGNEILDLTPAHPIADPSREERALREVTGVVETGLFVGLARRVVIGYPDGRVEERLRPPSPHA